MERVEEHERELTRYAMERLSEIPGVHMIGTAPNKISVLSFVIESISPEGMGRYLDQEGIAVRAGHHCAQPVLSAYGLESSVRASLGIYNTRDEVDSLANAVLKVAKMYH